MNLDEVHRVDLRGNHAENWAERHANWIRFWKKRSRRVVQSPEIVYNNFSPSDGFILTVDHLFFHRRDFRM